MPRLRLSPVYCLTLASLVSCGPSPAEVAAGTDHCGTTQLEPGLLMRVSSFWPYGSGFAERHWLVQACQPQGHCLPIVTSRDTIGPVYSLTREGGVVVELLGGTVADVHRQEIRFGGRTRPIIVRHITGRADVNRFRARMGLPPGRFSRDLCQPDLELRPSFAAP
jgi:hypothetical protein